MDDNKIVQLYWERNDQAIVESSNKYGTYCNSIAHNILFNWADAEEYAIADMTLDEINAEINATRNEV